MLTIDMDGVKKIEAKYSTYYTQIEFEHINGDRTKLILSNEVAEMLVEKLDEAVNEVTISDLQARIELLEEQLWLTEKNLRDRLEEAESHRDKLLERRVI